MAMTSIVVPVIGWFVSPTIAKVMEHGILHLQKQRRLKKGVSKEIERLSKVLPLIKGVLEDAEKKQAENSGVQFWLGELKEVLYDAEDVLDRYEVDLALMNQRDAEQQPTEIDWKAKVSGRFLSGLFSWQESSVDLSVAIKIKSITERLDYICKRGQELGLREVATSTSTQWNDTSVRQKRETISVLADGFTVFGRADEKGAIINMLLDDSRKLLVIPIIGMGGVGKTTLAKLVYNDEAVEAFFKSKAWVCIGMSKDMDLTRLMIQIIKSICVPQKRSENYDYCTLDLLQKILVEEIRDKQPCMLILDDAWDTEVYNWNRLLEPLKASGLACRIIVTTREQQVADAIRIDRFEPIRINLLGEADMWNIFSRYAFESEAVGVDTELESIGRQIVQRLKGLPLAAEVVGGILRENKDAGYWRRILESNVLNLKDEGAHIRSVLMLSYNSLPELLKQCFSYFSLFPKDWRLSSEYSSDDYPFRIYEHVVPIKHISYMWMSNGLAEIENGTSPDDIGGEIILQLVNRFLLQSTTSNGGNSSITIHDLVHDMIETIGREEFLRGSDVTVRCLPKKPRHVSFINMSRNWDRISEQELDLLRDLSKRETLRTFVFDKRCWVDNNLTSLLDGCINSWVHLRFLLLHHPYITALPDSVGNLKLLRYLDLRLPKLKKLPGSVSGLYNLRVLRLAGCYRLSTLDDFMTRLINLIKLDISEEMETLKKIGELTNLQQLKAFRVKREDGHRLTELQNLNRICGSLHILHIENTEAREAQGAQLEKKDGLKELKLSWGDVLGPDEEAQLDLLEGLRPSSNLTKLSLVGYQGSRLPSWLNREHLPFLKEFELHRCLRLKAIPSFTNNLEKLSIHDSPCLVAEIPCLHPKLRELRLVNVGVTSLFPSSSSSQYLPSPSIPCLSSLRTLHVADCPNLDESLGTLLKGSLPSLESLEVSAYRHPLGSFRHLTALSTLHLYKCYEKVGIDLGALVSLKILRIRFCPGAAIEEAHSDSNRCNSLSSLEVKGSTPLLRSLCQQGEGLLFSLKSLQIDGSGLGRLGIYEEDLDDSVLSGCLSGLSALKMLFMNDCHNITSIPEEVLCTLVSMERLHIWNCPQLEELDLHASMSLSGFSVQQITPLIMRASGSPLKKLEIDFCKELESFDGELELPFLSLTTLQRLRIAYCNRLRRLPSDLRGFKALHTLDISYCEQIASLPVEGFPDSLGRLYIVCCPGLEEW